MTDIGIFVYEVSIELLKKKLIDSVSIFVFVFVKLREATLTNDAIS